MRLRIWAAKSNSEFESWAIQEPSGKIVAAKDLTISASPVMFPKQELDSNPRAWVEVEGTLRFIGNGSAVIE